jgi:dTDP-4-amino-4,6-dideoxyglucose
MTAKRVLNDLAIFGGPPAFPARLHVGRPNIGNREALFRLIGQVLDNEWLTNDGPVLREFERRVAELSAVRHCVAMCNGTVALQVALRAIGLSGEVILPSFTFAATPHAVSWVGLTPVFCDIAPGTHAIDPDRAEELITPRTSAIVGVHLWGLPCSVDRLADISRRHGLALVYDGAHALGCTAGGRPVAKFGDATMVSFHATKFINSFEGGALLTDDAALAARARSMRNFGNTGDDVTQIGTNAKMTEAAAAMGLVSLDGMADIVARNRENWASYRSGLAATPGISVLGYPDEEANNYQYAVIEVDERQFGISRDDLLAILRAEQVMCRRYFFPGCHLAEPYRGAWALPETEALSARVMQLPTGMAVTPEQVRQICEIIQFAAARHASIGRRRKAQGTAGTGRGLMAAPSR